MNNVMDVETYVPQDGDKYFFDANIWLYFYCPIGNYNKNTICKYAGFLKKSIINSKTTIYISSLVISEIVNRWLKLDFRRVKRKDVSMRDFKHNYRGSAYYHSTVKDIKAVFNQLLKISTPLDDRATEISLPDVLSGLDKIDFNDCYYHYLAKLDNLLIVTNDADFAELDTGISILTANQKLLNVN